LDAREPHTRPAPSTLEPLEPAHEGAVLRVLHLEDSPLDHDLAARALQRAGLQVQWQRVDTLASFVAALAQDPPPHLVLADYHLPGFTALQAWEQALALTDAPPFVLLSGAIGEAAAVEAMRSGFADYILKDNLARLDLAVRRALQAHATARAKRQADAALRASREELAALMAHLTDRIEAERAAIAREIHDDIGGALAAARFDLAWMARHHADEATLGHVQSATAMLQHAVDASQRIMKDLRPAVLDQGLVAAVQWLADGFARRTRIATAVRVPAHLAALPTPVALAVYRTAQEALTNITKYAPSATQVRLDLSLHGGHLMLEVADNGPGLAHGARDKAGSFGLRGLAERARAVGGWLDVASQEGQGTTLILTIESPVPAAGPTHGQL
jgi:two-component system, NarL family, sensor histidine kinase UhpB